MEKNIINKPRISKLIGGGYIIITFFIAILFLFIGSLADIRSSPLDLQIFLYAVMIFVLFLLSFTTLSLYNTKYVISNGVLSSWSPFAKIRLRIKDIKKVERTLIPFHIRVGASLYCGMFYIPGIGWTKAIITNLRDGLLITDKNNKHYLITPSNPEEFKKILKR
jgi:hypothetical protein